MDRMRAFVLSSYGGPECTTLTDFGRPVPKSGQILVQVHAAGLNPVDFKTRQGMLKTIIKYNFPIVMGNELAGVIQDLGPDVSLFKKGDRVFVRVDKNYMGAFAEYAVVHENHAALIPARLNFRQAAAVPLAALTALQALRDELEVKPGDCVFIPGGAGGVGCFAIQIAKHLGAYVATTASPRGEELVKRLGADEVIDYTSERFQDKLKDYDSAFDLIGGETLADTFSILKPGGRVVSVAGMPEPLTARKDLGAGFGLSAIFWVLSWNTRRKAGCAGCTYRYLFMRPSGKDLNYLTQMIENKKLEVVIDKVFPFTEVKEAMAHLESGRAKGKVVIEMIPEQSN